MPLTKAALLALKGLDRKGKERIAEASGVEPSSIYRWIAHQHDNLTLAATMEAISKEIGLPVDQILEKPSEEELQSK